MLENVSLTPRGAGLWPAEIEADPLMTRPGGRRARAGCGPGRPEAERPSAESAPEPETTWPGCTAVDETAPGGATAGLWLAALRTGRDTELVAPPPGGALAYQGGVGPAAARPNPDSDTGREEGRR